MFAGVLKRLLTDPLTGELYPEQHRVRLTLMTDGLDREVYVPFMSPSELTADRVMLEVERVLQSNQDFLLNEPIRLLFVHAPIPSGGINAKRFSVKLEAFLKEKRSLVTMKVSITLCNDGWGVMIGCVCVDKKKKFFYYRFRELPTTRVAAEP